MYVSDNTNEKNNTDETMTEKSISGEKSCIRLIGLGSIDKDHA